MELIYTENPPKAVSRVIAKIIKPKSKSDSGIIINHIQLVKGDRQLEGHTSYAQITSVPRQYYCTMKGLALLTERQNAKEMSEKALEVVEEMDDRMRVKTPYDLQVGDIVYFKFQDIADYFDEHRDDAYLIADPEDFVAYKRDGKLYPVNGYVLGKPHDIDPDIKRWKDLGIIIPDVVNTYRDYHFESKGKVYITQYKQFPYILDENFQKIHYLWKDSLVAELVDNEYIPVEGILFVKVDKEGIKSNIEDLITFDKKLKYTGWVSTNGADTHIVFSASLRRAVPIKGEDYLSIREEQVSAILEDDVKAVGDFIVVRRDEVKDKTESGIIIPNPEIPTSGVVLSVGERVEGINVGDHIKFDKFAGTEITYKGQHFLIIYGKEPIYTHN